ncbi:MAG: YdiU family protein [Gammaproteobacteria bacterium]|nr:YdiU family protein [Gammaproteobacteria bacterium]
MYFSDKFPHGSPHPTPSLQGDRKGSFSDLGWTNTFAGLGEAFYSRVQPTPFDGAAWLIHINRGMAQTLGLDAEAMDESALLANLSGQAVPKGADPLAMLYAGHQFGTYVPQLGDGRAIMLGEIRDPANRPWEIQLKGSGLTPYSRQGDGRAVLRSTLREYLCSEAMHGLGIPTTRALAMVGSDEEVYREHIEPGAMLARLAPSHVRFGSFEVFFYRNQYDHIRSLADYVLEHHYPELKETANPYQSLLVEVIQRTARLIAKWQAVGFAHGVMNSDNMSILGLTIDYGPFGFLESYQPGYICNHSDYSGRYAFDQQPNIGLFNLSCLAQALLPLFDDDPNQGAEWAKSALAEYQGIFVKTYASLMRAKLGLQEALDEDQSLLEDLLSLMQQGGTDYTILFRKLSEFTCGGLRDANPPYVIRDLFLDREDFDAWAERYALRLQKENSVDDERCERMNNVNPKYILRNYLAEVAIRKAEDEKDYSEIDSLFKLLQKPFDEQPENEHYAAHPPDWASGIEVSCSS